MTAVGNVSAANGWPLTAVSAPLLLSMVNAETPPPSLAEYKNFPATTVTAAGPSLSPPPPVETALPREVSAPLVAFRLKPEIDPAPALLKFATYANFAVEPPPLSS